MRRNRRLTVAGVAAAVATAVTAAVVATAPAASAAVLGTFVTSNNGSDPHIIQCNDGSTAGYCLYTSQDMGQQYAYPSANYYPMRDTLVYFSPNGYNNWTYKGVAFSEDKLDSWAGKRTNCVSSGSSRVAKSPDMAPNCRAYHLWAPSALKISNTEYILYVPDVVSTADSGAVNIHNSSRIAKARSTTGPFGPFVYEGNVSEATGNYPGYMSDPDIIADGNNRYLIWADGDFSNCGGFKSARLSANDNRTIVPSTIQTLTINGLDHASAGLGVCGNAGRPYLEGGSIYRRDFKPGRPWTLIFPAKPGKNPSNPNGPDVVPKECNTDNAAPGTAQTANSVILWASATSPQGPYEYEGLIMCGSLHEWTNQATVAVTSNSKTIMIYHDAADGNKNRKLQAQCLFYGAGHIGGVFRQAPNASGGFDACTTTSTDVEYRALWGKDPQQPSKAPLISTGGDEMIAKRYAVGPWERYKLEWVATNTYVIRAMSNGKLICAPNNTTALAPKCTSTTDTQARFGVEYLTDGHFQLKSKHNNLWVGIAGNGRVYMSATKTSDAASFAWLSYMAQ